LGLGVFYKDKLESGGESVVVPSASGFAGLKDSQDFFGYVLV